MDNRNIPRRLDFPLMLPLAEMQERIDCYQEAGLQGWRRVHLPGVLIGGLEVTWREWCTTTSQETVRELREALTRW